MCPPKRNNHYQDMFTLLEESIILLIISCLPFKDAVRTSVLSKSWRNLWRLVEAVEFHEKLYAHPNELNDEVIIREREKFIASADQTMAYRAFGFFKFALSFTKPKMYSPEINRILTFSPKHKINTLSLDFSDPTWDLRLHDVNPYVPTFHLPSHLYDFKGIESLKLFSCFFSISGFMNFSALRDLSLGWIELARNTLERIIANCPLLESLTLKSCYRIDGIDISSENLTMKKLILDRNHLVDKRIVITAPHLTNFKYNGGKAKIIICGELLNIQEVELIFEQEKQINFPSYFRMMLNKLRAVQKLTICSYVLQLLSTLPVRLRPVTLNVRHLTMRMGFYGQEWFGFLYIMMRCTSLETLILDITPPNVLEDDVDPVSFWRHSSISGTRCMNTTLELIEINSFTGTKYQLDSLKYLLMFGRSLRALNIYPSRHGVDEATLETYMENARRVQGFPKSSTTAVVSIC